VKIGTFILTFLVQPYSVSVFTDGKVAVSGPATTPFGRPFAPQA